MPKPSIAPGSGSRPPAPARRLAAPLLIAILAGASCGEAIAAPPSFKSIGSGFKAFSKAASKAFSGKPQGELPKQASRLPLPPDAHADDDAVLEIARPPIGEPTEPSPTAAAAPPAAKPAPLESIDDLMAFASSVGASARTIVTASLDPSYARAGKASGARARQASHSNDKRSARSTAAQKPRDAEKEKEKEDAAKGPIKKGPEARPTDAGTTAEKPLAPATHRHATTLWTVEGSAAPPPKNDRLERLRRRIAQTLAVYKKRPLNTQDHTPWEVMHGFLAYGIGTEVRVGGPRGSLVNAIGWVNSGGRCHGQTMLATNDGRVVALKGVGVQGHSAQYLAILAQCRVAADSPLTPQRKEFTVRDLIEQEKLDCKSKTELTFALIGLAHYLPTDATWQSRDGESWSLERLVAEELEQPIRGAPCGGSHRLFGLAYGCQRRLRATGSLEGIYERADAFVRDYQLMTLTKLQNPDGSFSTEWYKFPTAQNREDDIDRKIQTTGHMLEWLVASLDQESLYHSRVTRAVEFLNWALASEPDRPWAIGPMCHALHALSVYQERMWGVVLPGAVAAFKGPMKAMPESGTAIADKSKPTARTADTRVEDDAPSAGTPPARKPAVRR